MGRPPKINKMMYRMKKTPDQKEIDEPSWVIRNWASKSIEDKEKQFTGTVNGRKMTAERVPQLFPWVTDSSLLTLLLVKRKWEKILKPGGWFMLQDVCWFTKEFPSWIVQLEHCFTLYKSYSSVNIISCHSWTIRSQPKDNLTTFVILFPRV